MNARESPQVLTKVQVKLSPIQDTIQSNSELDALITNPTLSQGPCCQCPDARSCKGGDGLVRRCMLTDNISPQNNY